MRLVGKLLLFVLLALVSNTGLKSQQVSTLYFMENVPVRHFLNPAFQPLTEYYLSFPVVGFSQFGLGNNSFRLQDVFYQANGKTYSFLSSAERINRFYSQLKPTTLLTADARINLLGFGWNSDFGYLSVTVTERGGFYTGLPKDAFKLLFYGTPDVLQNNYDLKRLEAGLQLYTEYSLGYSALVDDRFSFGLKFKYLSGTASFFNNNKQLGLQAGVDKWSLQAEGAINYSSPAPVSISDDYRSVSYTSPSFFQWLKPAGVGAGLDFGTEYRLNKRVSLSAALLDLGFISWSKNTINLDYKLHYDFDGVIHFDDNSTSESLTDAANRLSEGSTLADSLSRAFEDSLVKNKTNNRFRTTTSARINVGAEYRMLNNQLSLGVLVHSRVKSLLEPEITLSVNAHPQNWINASLSATYRYGRIEAFGAGLGLRLGDVHFFTAADYLPLQTVSVPLLSSKDEARFPLPYNKSYFNMAVGINIVFDTPETARKLNALPEPKDTRRFRPRLARLLFLNSHGLYPQKNKQNCRCDWH